MSVLRNVANMAECGQEQIAKSTYGGPLGRPSNLTENLEARKETLEAQLSRVNATLAALKENPKFEEMINLLSSI